MNFDIVLALTVVGSALLGLIGLALCALRRTRRAGIRIAIYSAAIFICAIVYAALEGSPELNVPARNASAKAVSVGGLFHVPPPYVAST
jgi:hypothetical protein